MRSSAATVVAFLIVLAALLVAPSCAPVEGGCGADADGALPGTLSETGIGDEACVRSYEPRAFLWSDGADKSRRVFLPDDGAIDDGEMDHWRLPVGTKLWKTFAVDGKNVETRFLWQSAPNLWRAGVYAWSDDVNAALIEGDADADADGDGVAVHDARGTSHDIPTSGACVRCHGDSMEPIGFSAIQLGVERAEGVTLASLVDEGRLAHAPRALALPGDELDREVAARVHANCGHCHRDGGEASFLTMRLRLESARLGSVEESALFRTAVDVDAETSEGKRIARGAPDDSLVAIRMAHRGDDGVQMPPLGTDVVDADTLALVRQWIARLAQ